MNICTLAVRKSYELDVKNYVLYLMKIFYMLIIFKKSFSIIISCDLFIIFKFLYFYEKKIHQFSFQMK